MHAQVVAMEQGREEEVQTTLACVEGGKLVCISGAQSTRTMGYKAEIKSCRICSHGRPVEFRYSGVWGDANGFNRGEHRGKAGTWRPGKASTQWLAYTCSVLRLHIYKTFIYLTSNQLSVGCSLRGLYFARRGLASWCSGEGHGGRSFSSDSPYRHLPQFVIHDEKIGQHVGSRWPRHGEATM